jgi:hypothetical protein
VPSTCEYPVSEKARQLRSRFYQHEGPYASYTRTDDPTCQRRATSLTCGRRVCLAHWKLLSTAKPIGRVYCKDGHWAEIVPFGGLYICTHCGKDLSKWLVSL